VFPAELTRAVNAGLAEYDRPQAVDARVIERVLIAGALGAAVRRMRIESAVLPDAAAETREGVASGTLDDAQIRQPSVNLVRRAVDDHGLGSGLPRRLEHIERSERVHLEIVTRV